MSRKEKKCYCALKKLFLDFSERKNQRIEKKVGVAGKLIRRGEKGKTTSQSSLQHVADSCRLQYVKGIGNPWHGKY